MRKITKKSIKSTLFLVFVLFLFSGCSKNLVNCSFFPEISESGDIEKVDKVNLLKSLNEARKSFQFKCNF
jgi:uncharacterized lipoprotein YajG|tara:strand:+ start:2678 stop:2887 length:210 start_codon:yes stop_codon:yes gene_type:complete